MVLVAHPTSPPALPDGDWVMLPPSTYTWLSVPPVIEPLPQDRRFKGEAWQQWPYNLVYQGFLLQQQWWHNATTGVRDKSDIVVEGMIVSAHQDIEDFTAIRKSVTTT